MELTEENISEMLENIPTFSQSVLRVMELTGDLNSSTKELVQQITHDPILTARVLKVVNSAFFGLTRQVDSIQQSVVYIGINTIKNLAISVAAMGALPRTNDAGLDMNHFWLHSLMTASVAKEMARQRKVPSTEVSTYFISGLLHDIGQIIFSQAQPDVYREVLAEAAKQERPLCDIERETFGVDHAELGARLGEKWQLPVDMVSAIRWHHHPLDADEDNVNQPVNFTLFAAGNVCKTLEAEDDRLATIDEIPDEIQTWLGLPIEQVASTLDNLNDEIENARVFIQ
jgi:putative nucleotidyltransferase with HDIG domain